MKRTLLKGMLLLTAIVLISAACNKDEEEKIVLDFDITVPESWLVVKLNQDNMVYYAQSPPEGSLDSIREDLLITKEAIGSASLTAYYDAVIDALEADTTFVLLSSTDTSINGEESQKFIHLQTVYSVNSYTQDTVDLSAKMIKYVFAHNSSGYVVSCNALQSSFNRYEPVYDTIIKSFKFKN
jgi:hypothetical protein